ncbi:MAG: dual specificity protein phosphatase [Planctomycetota bacterium]
MDWITETIAIGNHRDARDEALIAREGLRSALSLDGSLIETRAGAPGAFETIECFRLIDGPGNDSGLFLRALNAFEYLVRRHPPVLVQCHAGRSRSVVLVAALLMRRDAIDSV